jgi:cold shock CspA family protein
MNAFQVSNVAKLQVAKAIGSLDFVAKKMNRRLFSSREQWANVVHDMEVLRMVGNLRSVTAEFLGGNGSVVLAQTIEFSLNGNGNGHGKLIDSACGVEVPIIPPGLIVNHEFSISWNDRSQHELVRHLLKNSWCDKPETTKAKGTEIPLKHHEKITGGQNGGKIFVSDMARHFGRVMYVAEGRGFAFALDETLGKSVWLHISHVARRNGFAFKKGARVSFVVVDVPAGLQGRDIRST